MKTYLTPKELEAEYNLTIPWQNKERFSRCEGLPFIKVGRKVIYDRNDIEAFLAARKVNIQGGTRREG